MTTETITHRAVRLEEIRTTSLNPRKRFDEAQLAELTESVRSLGVLQPILVRPVNGHLEIVAGERRYRAAVAAGLAEIPVVVRDLDDRQAAEARIVENIARADLDPLEEAEAYRELHERHKLGVDEIAEKVSKSRAYVYARMKLAELPEKAKEALAAGELSASVALLLARLPAEVAKEALPAMFRDDWQGGGPVPFKQAQRIISERYARRLRSAPWNPGDETLPGGACTVCPRRTGSAPDLFEDMIPDRADVCTDVPCWTTKLAAWRERKLEKEAAKGATPVDEKLAKKLYPYGDREEPQESSGYVDLGAACWSAPRGKKGGAQTWKQALGGKVDPAETLVHVGQDGKVRHLIRRSRALEIAREAGREWAKESDAAAASVDKQKETKKKLAIARAASAAATGEMVVEAAGGGWGVEQWRAVVSAAWERMHHDGKRVLFARREWTPKKEEYGVRYHLPDLEILGEGELKGLLVEILFAGDGLDYQGNPTDVSWSLLEAFGVTFWEHLAAAKKAAAAKAKKKPAAKGKGKKGGRKAEPATGGKPLDESFYEGDDGPQVVGSCDDDMCGVDLSEGQYVEIDGERFCDRCANDRDLGAGEEE